MSETRGATAKSLRRAVRDVVLIVVSILIAFWLAGWREARADRELLSQHLIALGNEFAQIRTRIAEELESVVGSAEGSRAMLELMDPEATPNPDQVVAAALQSMRAGIFTSQDPVLTAMLTSGELVDLRNDSLMSRLAEWRARIAHLRIDSQDLERNRQETLFDRMIALGQSYEAFQLDAPAWTTQFGELEMEVLTSDRQLGVVYIVRLNRAVRLSNDYRAALDECSALIDLIESEIERIGAV